MAADDTTLWTNPTPRRGELIHRHCSGKHQRVVNGIKLVTLLWSDGQALLPTDFRAYDKPRDELTKNDHLRAMLRTANERGFDPRYVLFDSWYSSLFRT